MIEIKNIKYKNNLNTGAAMMITVFFFVFLSFTILSGVIAPVIKTFQTVAGTFNSKQAYFTAESGMEDAIYRVNNGFDIGSTETLVLGSSSTTTTLNTSSGTTTISTLASNYLNTRNMEATLTSGGFGLTFAYGILAGPGGLYLNNGVVNGDVYASGDITSSASNSNTITGSAWNHSYGPLVNGPWNAPTTGSTSTNFCISGTQDIAVKFSSTDHVSPINKVSLYLKRSSTMPPNATVYIVTDDPYDTPSPVYIAKGTLTASSVGTTYAWVDIPMETHPTFREDELMYWVVMDCTPSSGSYTIRSNYNFYWGGKSKYGTYGGTLTELTPLYQNYLFKVFLEGLDSKISGYNSTYKLNVGNASGEEVNSKTVNYVTTSGSLYCESGTGNNKSCGTYVNPVFTEWPVDIYDIQEFRDNVAFAEQKDSEVNTT